MPKLYTTQRVNFGTAQASDLPRYEYHRSLREAIELSLSSYSHQEVKGGRVYQWDNLAPEVARVILQDAAKKGINIKENLLNSLASAQAYEDAVLEKALDVLNSNPDYSLFVQKFLLQLNGKVANTIRLEDLKLAGIDTSEKFEEIYTQFLMEQKKLTKNYPNFNKIKVLDDYHQVIDFLASNPLYDKFMQSFIESLANEYNKNRDESTQVSVPKNLDKKSIENFLMDISYDLVLSTENPTKKNTLNIEIIDDKLQYRVIALDGKVVTGTIKQSELGFVFDNKTTESELRKHLRSILKITENQGHTSDFARNNTAAIKAKGLEYLSGDINHDLFLAHVPSTDLITDERAKYTVYQWLEQGNLPILQDQLVEATLERYTKRTNNDIQQAKDNFPEDQEFAKNIDEIAAIMNEIIAAIAALETDHQVQDKFLDEKITELAKKLKWIQDFYSHHPILRSGQLFPSTEGNYQDFIKKIIFHATQDKIVGFIRDPNDNNNLLKINLPALLESMMRKDNVFFVKDNNKDKSVLVDEKDEPVSPLDLLREQLKEHITTQLKNNVHQYHTLRTYQNDVLNLQRAPVGFRGGNLTDNLSETKSFAKKITRRGEYSADSHLLTGQENNIKKHEVRSGTAATLLAATGVDGTRSATDSLDVAIQFGGTKEVKIMYILRGKDAVHSHHYLDPLGKNKMSEIAYTSVDPSDYIMTILYDKNNVILDVITGNLDAEITGVSKFTSKVLEAGIEFYNMSHNPDYVATIKLPDPVKQKKTPTTILRQPKPLIEIMQSHKTGLASHNDQNDTLGIIKINRDYSPQGNKILTLHTLRPEIKRSPLTPKKLTIPNVHFNFNPDRLNEVRSEANRHYQMRHVLTLGSFGSWSAQERQIQETYNRILQPGFMAGDLDDQLRQAQLAKEEWLTDVLVPTVETALLLNVSARLITDYAVDIEEINKISQQIMLLMVNEIHELMQVSQEVSRTVSPLNAEGPYASCVKKAQEKMIKYYPTLEEGTQSYAKIFDACLNMEINKVRKQLTHQLIGKILDAKLDPYTEKMQLEKKPVFLFADNKDFVFLGPAASGKSTISNQYFSPEDKKQYVSLATDDYRSICRPYTADFEQQETEQVFVRTQDSAYLVSELVEARMQNKQAERPNVIVDGVTYKPSHRTLVEKNNNSVLVCACLDDISKVVQRSYNRAIQEDAGSADKGRHVNTSSLIHMHKTASINLIKFCAPNSKIALYDTNVLRGTTPPLIGVVDTHGAKVLTVSSGKDALPQLASFFNKNRVNVNAENDESLFFSKLRKVQFQIDSLFAVLDFGYKIVLNGEDEMPFLEISKGEDNKITMDILNPTELKTRLLNSAPGREKDFLSMLVVYGHYGTLKEVNKQCLLHNNKVDEVIEKILASIPESEFTNISINQSQFGIGD